MPQSRHHSGLKPAHELAADALMQRAAILRDALTITRKVAGSLSGEQAEGALQVLFALRMEVSRTLALARAA